MMLDCGLIWFIFINGMFRISCLKYKAQIVLRHKHDKLSKEFITVYQDNEHLIISMH